MKQDLNTDVRRLIVRAARLARLQRDGAPLILQQRELALVQTSVAMIGLQHTGQTTEIGARS